MQMKPGNYEENYKSFVVSLPYVQSVVVFYHPTCIRTWTHVEPQAEQEFLVLLLLFFFFDEIGENNHPLRLRKSKVANHKIAIRLLSRRRQLPKCTFIPLEGWPVSQYSSIFVCNQKGRFETVP